MSETQSTHFNKRACGLWIAGAFFLLRIVVRVRVLSPKSGHRPVQKKHTACSAHSSPQMENTTHRRSSNTPQPAAHPGAIGDTLDATPSLVDIQRKYVILEIAGQQRALPLNQKTMLK